MDFYHIKERHTRNGVEVYPDFKVCRSKDLMVRGKNFYAIWDEERSLWSTDEYDVQRLVDKALFNYADSRGGKNADIKLMSDFSTKSWSEFRNYIGHISDNAHQLDTKLTFADTIVHKKDYVSKRLSYPLKEGSIEAYDELIGTLYEPSERAKLEWAIGAVVSGDSCSIQKFIVLYGEAGAGKSTILNIIQRLFEGYYTAFEAKALTSSSNAFSTEVFKSNPLVAIQHDGDLSKIEDNTKLNSIISHEEMTMNEKYKPSYMARINAFLFMATNRPVKITDAKSGIIRRLIDVKPSGKKVPPKHYHALMSQIDFELGAIAHHCLEVYKSMGKNYYNGYRPMDMILQTDVFFNFVESNFHVFKEQDGITLSHAYDMYKSYCDEALVEYKSPKHKFREELKNYFGTFSEVKRLENGTQVRSYYSDFMIDKFTTHEVGKKQEHQPALVLDSGISILDSICADCPAQYATASEKPNKPWEKVNTKLSDLDTKKIHYVKLPLNHIVVDFDLKDSGGKKSMERNLEAASLWPPTYAEYSKSGGGIHLHYIYDGDATELTRLYAPDIEVKVSVGNSSLRRKLTKCNTLSIATIATGIPRKEKKVIDFKAVSSEKVLREMITKNLRKEIHHSTKPSLDFIDKLLSDAYKNGVSYDVTDMRPKLLAFAVNSSNQSDYCIKLVGQLKYKSEEPSQDTAEYTSDELVFYDVEVFPNLFIICWKVKGNPTVVKMINPKSSDIESLLKRRLIGFNNRRYDNHILYAAYIGYTNAQIYELSQRIIAGSKNAMFAEAYNLSYTDIYDFSSVKQSLKKFEIDLGIHHQELGLPWNEPVPEEKWELVADYCCNDVIATEKTFEDRKQDWIARQILADLSGLSVNDSTQNHTAKIIFGNDKKPQEKFVYTNLAEMFPGYKYEFGKSTYRDVTEVGEGGYVYSNPGMYCNVALLDVVSMHPNSLINMNMFGIYTPKFKELLDARVAIKRKDYDLAREMLGGILKKYLTEESASKDLAYALKIVINIVYGLTSAKFENKFKDNRNVDNIVAKRGALFMIDLRHEVAARGFTVTHIKTDSIKIPNATKDIVDFVFEFGAKYGYEFEHEETYDKICLVNDAVYIAKTSEGKWTATGAQFAHPYVFKTLFSHEPLEFKDFCEAKSVATALYLDMNESLGEEEHDYHFVGKVGLFVPIKPGSGGGILLREKDGKYHAATGTKGYRWMEAEMVESLGLQDSIDTKYFDSLVDDAVENISKYGDFEWFTNNLPDAPPFDICTTKDNGLNCTKCEFWITSNPHEANTCRLGYDCLPF